MCSRDQRENTGRLCSRYEDTVDEVSQRRFVIGLDGSWWMALTPYGFVRHYDLTGERQVILSYIYCKYVRVDD